MADERIIKRRLELRVKVFRARLNYLAIGLLTLVNVVLMLIGADMEMPFYMSIPYFSFLTGRDCIGNPELFGGMILWFTLAVLFVGVYIWLFIRSRKNNRIGGLLALVLLDTAGNVGIILLAVVMSAVSASIFTQFLNLAFHIFVIVFIEGGRRAAYGLTLLPDTESEENGDSGEGIDENEENEENEAE